MATKTFKTRIKLKYDLQSAWENTVNPFSALTGELLLGKDNGTPNKVFANVGTEDGIKPLSILTNNVLIKSVNGDVTSYQTLTDKLTAIDNALGAGDSDLTTLKGRVTTAEGKITALEGKMTTAEGEIDTLQSDLDTAEGKITTLEGKMTTAEGKITTLEGKMTTAEDNITANAEDIEDLGGRMDAVEDVAGSAVQTITGDGNVIATRPENSNSVTLSHKTVSPTANPGNAITVGIGESKEINIPYISFDGTGHIQNNGTQKVTITIPDAEDLGLSNALHFLGVTTTTLTDGATIASITINGQSVNAVNGDVVLDRNKKEFVFDGTTWHELGDASANTTAISEINTKIDGMDYTLLNGAANKTITALTQEDGKITVATLTTIAIPTSQVTTLDGYMIATGSGSLATTDTLNEALGKLEKGIAINKTNIESNDTDIADLQGRMSTAEAAITTLNEDESVEGSVAHSINAAIIALDSVVTAKDNDTTIPNNNIYVPATDTFNVLEKVTITEGLLVPDSSSAVTLKKLAATANVNDLIQTDDDCIIFDCGSSTLVTNVENEA